MRSALYLINALETIRPDQLNARERRAYLEMLDRLRQVLDEFVAGCDPAAP
jgi:hypothetical protein